ncbi:actin [Danaus plexippus plexippus]|uniref:Actin n=1 Tax=Danaus plexippus plexippus TaxID=278856 RepID=A0A212EQF7_DANPL|nr:actin [Danaus plexippus plexippus]
MSADRIAVVFDSGSQSTKAGFAGESSPRSVIKTLVGRFRHEGLLDGLPDIFFGNEAVKKRGFCVSTWPVKDGMIDDWNEVEKFWHHIFYKELHVAPEEAQLLMSIHPLTPHKDKEKMAEILFESLSIHDLYLAISSALALHANGRTSGLVWENGHSCSYVSPVFEGFPLKHATIESEINGSSLTKRLQKLLNEIGYSFTTSVEIDILEDIKAKLCYVAMDYENEVQTVNRLKDSTHYELPDGQHVLLCEERFKCPEMLFQPKTCGMNSFNIVDNICSSISKCDLEYKTLFYDNIVLSGGSSLFRGLSERLSVELSRRVSDMPGIKANVSSIPSRHYSSWLGGSILASLKSLHGFWMTKQEYDDNGPERVHYKFF